MRNCSNCNAILEEDARFCSVCGTPVAEIKNESDVSAQPQNENKADSAAEPVKEEVKNEAAPEQATADTKAEPAVETVTTAAETEPVSETAKDTAASAAEPAKEEVKNEAAPAQPAAEAKTEPAAETVTAAAETKPVAEPADNTAALAAEPAKEEVKNEAAPTPAAPQPAQAEPATAPAQPAAAPEQAAAKTEPAPAKAEAKPVKAKKEKKGMNKGIPFIIAGVVILFVSLIVFVAAFASMGLIKAKNKTPEQYAFYLKDDSIYCVEGKGKPVEITSAFAKEDDISPDYMSFYRNGKTVYFTDKNETSGYNTVGNLVEVNINKPNEKNKIDSEVLTDYYVDVDKSYRKMIYYKDGTYYRYNLKKDEKEKLAETRIGGIMYSDDLDNLVYIDDESRLYAKFGKNDKEKISDDVYSYSADFKNLNSNSEIFYITKDMDDEDSQMILSVYKNGQKTEIMRADFIQCHSYEGGKAYFLTSYYEKQLVELYYYNGNAATLCGNLRIDPTYYYTFAEENPMMVYLNENDEYHLLIENNDNLLFEEDDVVGNVTFCDNGKRFVVSTYSESSNNNSCTGLLYSITKLGPVYSCKLEKTIDDMGDMFFNDDGNIIYTKDYEPKNDVGTLYFEDEFIASDVYAVVGRNAKTGKKIYYLTDYDSNKNQGTLYVWNGKKAKQVSSDVKSVKVHDDGSIYYLYDYSDKRHYGDLYYYNGRKPVKVDIEVESVRLSDKPLGAED